MIADSPFDDSTLKNDHLTDGSNHLCHDGILLLDGVGDVCEDAPPVPAFPLWAWPLLAASLAATGGRKFWEQPKDRGNPA